MSRLLLAALLWTFATLPCHAATNLELGTTTHVSVHLEGPNASIGLGIGVQYFEETFAPFLGVTEKIHIVTFYPTAMGRLFLNEGTTRSFLEVRATKEISSVSGETPDFILGTYDEFLDDWSGSLGFGFRAGLNERLRVGGALELFAEFQTFSDREDTIRGGTAFRVFLDYALAP